MQPNDHELYEALRADLRQKIRERLRLWLKDSTSLYEMAEVHKLHAVEDILYTLLHFSMSGVTTLNLDPKGAAKLMEVMLIHAAKARDNRESQKSTKEEST
jgi:hypothetical protein